ncbi:hypothetical protein [Cryobacterium roopkundense]|uniref:Rv2175c C-terminal domain-containing protein n=2 Tax=Cryobacterium roopkundense TaxID=1001240 RepID=A0A7W8ZZN2_9MICO|nr:hypothetical protein [Cryobacterium roopkundense]MBB5643173.1 hypothetical protein [Cryobacterium roopkundense]
MNERDNYDPSIPDGKRQPTDENTAAAAEKSAAVSPELAWSRRETAAAWRRMDEEFGLLDAGEVHELLGTEPDRDLTSSKLELRGLIRVEVGGRVLYPGFQIDRDKRAVLPVVAGLLDLAAENSWRSEDLALWLMGPSTSFEAEDRPVDHLREEPDAVLGAARSAFESC